MEMVVSSVSPRSWKDRSSSYQPKVYPLPTAFSRLAENMAEDPYRSPTFTVSLVTAEAETAESVKNVTTNVKVKNNFFMHPPNVHSLDGLGKVCYHTYKCP